MDVIKIRDKLLTNIINSFGVSMSINIDLDNFYIEYSNAYRTLTLYEKGKIIRGNIINDDRGFIIVEENKVDEIKNFITKNQNNPDKEFVITALSKMFPLEGNFKKMMSILQEAFKLSFIPSTLMFFQSETEIKACANKELYNAFLISNLIHCNRILEKYKNINLQPDQACVSAAIKSGSIEAVKFLKENYHLEPKDTSCFMYALDNAKSLDMVKYLSSNYQYLVLEAWQRNDLSWAAARSGNLELLKFCVDELQLPFDSGTLYDAVRSSVIDLVKYLVDDKGFKELDEAFHLAQENDFHDIKNYLANIANRENNNRPKFN